MFNVRDSDGIQGSSNWLTLLLDKQMTIHIARSNSEYRFAPF